MIPDYQLWHGDCLEEMSRIEDGSIDCILADLPYNVTNCHWDTLIPFEPLWKQYKRVIKKRGAVVLFGSQPFTSMLIMSNLEWFKYEWVWDKKLSTGFLDANRKPLKRHENILIFAQGQTTYNPEMRQGQMRRKGGPNRLTDIYGSFEGLSSYNDTYFPTSIIELSNANRVNRLHKTQKPVKLLEFLIKTYTNEGDTVLDSTCGSGSTLEAAMRCNRHSIGIEKDAGFFSVAQQRLERVVAELRGELNHLPLFAEIV